MTTQPVELLLAAAVRGEVAGGQIELVNRGYTFPPTGAPPRHFGRCEGVR